MDIILKFLGTWLVEILITALVFALAALFFWARETSIYTSLKVRWSTWRAARKDMSLFQRVDETAS